MANTLTAFKKLNPSGHGAEMLMINKTGKKRAQRYALLSKSAANRTQDMKCKYMEILINEGNNILALHPINESSGYSTRITKTHRIAAEGAWKQLESMGIELKERYALEWHEDGLYWTTKL